MDEDSQKDEPQPVFLIVPSDPGFTQVLCELPEGQTVTPKIREALEAAAAEHANNVDKLFAFGGSVYCESDGKCQPFSSNPCKQYVTCRIAE
jgi:hypothetical protein